MVDGMRSIGNLLLILLNMFFNEDSTFNVKRCKICGRKFITDLDIDTCSICGGRWTDSDSDDDFTYFYIMNECYKKKGDSWIDP